MIKTQQWNKLNKSCSNTDQQVQELVIQFEVVYFCRIFFSRVCNVEWHLELRQCGSNREGRHKKYTPPFLYCCYDYLFIKEPDNYSMTWNHLVALLRQAGAERIFYTFSTSIHNYHTAKKNFAQLPHSYTQTKRELHYPTLTKDYDILKWTPCKDCT